MAIIKVSTPSMDFTPIDNIFIDNYMSDARGDFIKVYLFLLRMAYSNLRMDMDDVAAKLSLLNIDVQKALEYWENLRIIKVSIDGSIEMCPLKVREANKQEVLFDVPIKEMFNGLEKLMGRPLSSKELSTYMSFIEDFGFPPEVINLLVEYCSSRKKTDIRYIEKVAISWHDSGIRELNSAMEYISRHEEKWMKYRSVLNYMGFKDTEVSKPQEDMLEKWLFKFNFSLEVIQEACKISVMRINECNFNYIDAILNDWQKNGVKAVSDIKHNEKKVKPHKKTQPNSGTTNSGKRQYNINELERQLLGRGESNEE